MFEGPLLSHFSSCIFNNTQLRKSTGPSGLLPPLLLLCPDSGASLPITRFCGPWREAPGIMKIAGNILRNMLIHYALHIYSTTQTLLVQLYFSDILIPYRILSRLRKVELTGLFLHSLSTKLSISLLTEQRANTGHCFLGSVLYFQAVWAFMTLTLPLKKKLPIFVGCNHAIQLESWLCLLAVSWKS